MVGSVQLATNRIQLGLRVADSEKSESIGVILV